MRNRAFRSIAAIISILLLTGIPAQAGPIVVSDVIQVLGNYQNPPDIRLRGVSQNSTALASGVTGSVQPSAVKQTASDGPLNVADTSSGAPVVTGTDSLLSGLLLMLTSILRWKSSMPATLKEPFVTAARYQLRAAVFPSGRCCFWLPSLSSLFMVATIAISPHTPTPTPTPPGVPEPASLFLFGTGLVAFGGRPATTLF